ncbi:MAG: hypothetical protein Q4F79_12585 [Eubacteriales bacterium]|nr:hypothetical protein [Eubacteriales bacterium]
MSLFDQVQESVAKELREQFGKDLYITGEEAVGTPPSFPAIVIQKDDEYINANTQDLLNLDVDRTKAYKVEVYSNATVGKVEETDIVLQAIVPVMADYRYRLTTNTVYPSMDTSVARRVARFYNYHVLPEIEADTE